MTEAAVSWRAWQGMAALLGEELCRSRPADGRSYLAVRLLLDSRQMLPCVAAAALLVLRLVLQEDSTV